MFSLIQKNSHDEVLWFFSIENLVINSQERENIKNLESYFQRESSQPGTYRLYASYHTWVMMWVIERMLY
jgi:hypothetical protein